MEQKKTLWIIAAVGLFLAVIIGTACIIYTPSAKSAPTIASITPVERKAPEASGWTNPAVDTSSNTAITEPAQTVTQNQPAYVSDLTVYSDNTKVYSTTPQFQPDETTTIDLNVLKNDLNDLKPADKNPNQNINITVNVNDSASASNNISDAASAITADRPDMPKEMPMPAPAPEVKPEKKDVKEAPKPVEKKPAPAPAKETVKVEKKAPSAAKTTEKAPAKTEPKKTQYWVQVGSYSAKKTAEVARSALDENKIPADIFTYKDAKGNLYFRVRVGPYTTKNEAEYWRSKIIKIAEFASAESYVVSTTN